MAGGAGVNQLRDQLESYQSSTNTAMAGLRAIQDQLDGRLVAIQTSLEAFITNFNEQFADIKKQLGVNQEASISFSPLEPKEKGDLGPPPKLDSELKCTQGRLEPIQTYLKKDKGGLGADEVSDGTPDKVINSIRCEICKINCNSRDVLEKHMLGKKHKRNVQMQMVPPAIFPSPLEKIPNESLGQTISGVSGAIVGEELETEKRKMLEGGASADSMIFCTVCNVACNSQAVFITHLSGRKHAAQVLENSNATNGNTDSTAPVVEPVNNMETSKGEVVDLHELKRKMTESLAPEPEDIETKKRKILEGGAAESDVRVCVLCNVVCNSQSVFIHHLSGRKHAAQVLENSNATNGNTDSTAPIVEPVDNIDTSKGEVVDLCELKRKMTESSQTPEPEDIETKKRKIVEGGASESDIRVCALCNVVCNSPSVFKFHLSGQKHAAMIKKQAEAEKDKANVQAALLFKQTLYGKKNFGGD